MTSLPDPHRREEVRSTLDRLLDLIADRIAKQLEAKRPPDKHRANKPGSHLTIGRKPNTKPEGK